MKKLGFLFAFLFLGVMLNAYADDLSDLVLPKFFKAKIIDSKKFGNITVVHLSVVGADHSDAFAIVTPQNKVIDIDDYAILSAIDIKKDPGYKDLAKKYPNVDSLWPGNHQYPEGKTLDGGVQQLQFTYRLLNGCHACAVAGLAHVAFNFDIDGTFLGTKLLNVSPMPEQ
jgi:hypothetical protein